MKRLARLAFVVVVVLIACASRPAPFTAQYPLPANAKPISPAPAFYHALWQQVEKCAGRNVSDKGVRYFVVIGPRDAFLYQGAWLAGFAFFRQRAIVFGAGYFLSPEVIAHEQLHLVAPEYFGHDPEYFRRRCAAIVTCTENCLTDAGPSRQPGH